MPPQGDPNAPRESTDERPDAEEALRTLSALGFGPESALMTEPKLFVDRNFLAVLLRELEDELGAEAARVTLHQIGFLHGLRDAARIAEGEPDPMTGVMAAEAPSLAMELGPKSPDAGAGELALPGRWPEAYEAEARLRGPGPASGVSCALSAGYTGGWLSELFGVDLIVVEESCRARGDAACRFAAREPEAWQRLEHDEACRLLRVLPIDTLRAVVAREGGIPFELEPAPHIDPEAPVVHVWGPVMVLPFEDPDETMRTLEMLSQEASKGQVRAVVLDLRNRTLDEGFDAASLENAIATIESWGAETVLTSVSSLSENVVQGLEVGHLLVRKDLPDAIAAAFQIVEAQRHAF